MSKSTISKHRNKIKGKGNIIYTLMGDELSTGNTQKCAFLDACFMLKTQLVFRLL